MCFVIIIHDQDNRYFWQCLFNLARSLKTVELIVAGVQNRYLWWIGFNESECLFIAYVLTDHFHVFLTGQGEVDAFAEKHLPVCQKDGYLFHFQLLKGCIDNLHFQSSMRA